jgi:hypothetical protein
MNGSILPPLDYKSATLVIRPHGNYLENELTLVIDKPSDQMPAPKDGVRIVLSFELPKGSFVTNAGYWSNDTLCQTKMIRREGDELVKDQAYTAFKLLKKWEQQYTLSMFSPTVNKITSLKITYLTPATFNDEGLKIELPLNILNIPAFKLQNLTLYVVDTKEYNSPTSIKQKIVFTNEIHPLYGPCAKSIIPFSYFQYHEIVLNYSIAQKSIYYDYRAGSDNYYQFQINPFELVSIPRLPKKSCFLIDFDPSNFIGSNVSFMNELKKNVENYWQTTDSFMVLYPSLFKDEISNKWMPVTKKNIQSAFSTDRLMRYLPLHGLIAKGLELIKQHGGDGEIVLITNDISYQNDQIELVNDLFAINEKSVKIKIVDFASKYRCTTRIGDLIYKNSAYFFSQLSSKTNGSYYQFTVPSSNLLFEKDLKKSLLNIGLHELKQVSVINKTPESLCYGNVLLTPDNDYNYSLDCPVHVMGRYKGKQPTTFEIVCEMDKQKLSTVVTFDQMHSYSDSLIGTLWNALDLSLNEDRYSFESVMERTISERILNNYTAFVDYLALDERFIDLDVKDEAIVPEIKTYPNPFSSKLAIDLSQYNSHLHALKVFNLNGNCVKTFYPMLDQLVYDWDGKRDDGAPLPKGIYVVVATFADSVVKTKVVKK